MVMEYQKKGRVRMVEFDNQIYAGGANILGYIEFLRNLDQFKDFSEEDLIEYAAYEYEYVDNSSHAAVLMTNLGKIEDIQENNDYDRKRLYQDLIDLGYENPPSIRVIDIFGKRNDFFEENPANLIVIAVLPGKNKVLVVGAIPKEIKTSEDLENWANTVLKYKFPNKNFKFSENNWVLDYQGEKRLERLESLVEKVKTPENLEYWQKERDKFKSKLNYLKENERERYDRKNIKDLRNNIFTVTCVHAHHFVITLPNKGFATFAGDAFLKPEYQRGEGVGNGMEQIEKLMEIIPLAGTPLQEDTISRLTESFTQILDSKLEQRKAQFTLKSQEDFERRRNQGHISKEKCLNGNAI
jgi:hypothetical protein